MTAPEDRLVIKVPTDIPDMGTAPLPIEPYISAEFFEKERDKVFRKAWLNVGRVDEIPEPGDYLVKKLAVLNATIIVVRGKDDQIRAFHNICVHRGMQVTEAGCEKGHAEGFMCGYHAWVYDLEGKLKNVPGKEYFPDTDFTGLQLPPVTLDTWNGFIFINDQEKPKVGLAEYLGGLADDLGDYPFSKFSHIARYRAKVAVNWKTFIDAFHEAYHVAEVHKNTIPDGCNSPDNPNAVPTSARLYPPHHSVSVPVNTAYVPTPAAGLAWQFGASFAPGEMGGLPGMNPSGDEAWWFDINVLFPNFFIDVGPGWYFTYNFWPVSVDETHWEMNIYQLEAQTAAQKIAQEHTKVLLRDILYEDLSTMEQTHESMKSGKLKTMIVGEMEIAVRHQLYQVTQWVEGKGCME